MPIGDAIGGATGQRRAPRRRVTRGEIVGRKEAKTRPAPAPEQEPIVEAPAAYQPTEDELLAEQRNSQFGNDMSWLDPIFQQKAPTRDEIMSLGTTGDEEAQRRQRGAADELFSLYKQGGLDARNRAARAANRRETENLLLGQRQADMQGMAERGMSGSGAELAALLGGNQAAAQRLSSADLQTSADAEQRALNALMGGTEIESGLQKSADAYTQNNARMIADIQGANTQGLRQAYQNAMNSRTQFDLGKLGLQTQAAQGVANRDAGENQYGFGYGKDLATNDSNAFNEKQGQYNTDAQNTYLGYVPAQAQAGQNRINYTGGSARYGGQSASQSGGLVMDIMGRMGGMGGGK